MGIGKRRRIYEHPQSVQVYLMRDAYGSRKQEVLPGVETTALEIGEVVEEGLVLDKSPPGRFS